MTAFRAAFKAYRMHQVLIMPRFARLTIALGLATAVFPVDAEYYFNPRFLSNDLAESVDLSAFTKGREAPPGTYRVDIYLNDEFMTSRDITFIADDNNAELIPCLSTDLLVSLGIKKIALLDNKEHSAEKHVPDNSACTPLQDRLADASTEFDVGQQHLSLSVPQIYVGRMARGYVSPDLWEEGINAGLLNYSFNGNSINNRSNHNAGKSNYAYLNLQSGINIGSWRLRDNSTWSYYSGSSNSSDSNKWQHINTSAERDIIPLRSRLTVGDSYTDGDIFDSVNFRGLKINSTEAMLPDSQHGFAPVIHGIARGTAQVSVKQNGYDVYQTTVPPGPFTIDDINSAANGGDLQVTIKEADGSIQTLYVPYSSVPVLQRAGYTRYALAMGEYRSGNNLQSSPKFIQGSLMHGLEGNWTPYGGMQIAEDYQAFNLGIITSELSTIRRGTFMKSALKKSVVSTSISLILASGMAAFAAHAADDVKLKATKTNVAFSDFTPTEYSTKGKPNIIVLTMDDLGYGQLPFDKGSFDPKTMENREVVDTYKIGIDKAIEAAQKSTPTLLSLMDEGVRFTNGYVAHGVSGPSRAAIMTGRAPARFGVYSNTDAQDGIPLTETFLPELFQNHGYYTAAVGKWHLSKISNVPVPEDKQTRDYHDNFTTFSAEEWQPQNRGFDYFMGFHAAGTAYYNSPSLFKNRERVPAKGYISDQLTDEAIGVVDRAKTLDQPFMLYLAYNAPHLPNDNPAPDQYQKQFNTGSQTADNYYASVYSVDQGVKRILEQLKKNGQYDNTIILFTSDNGAVIDGPLPLNGAQKGYKSQTYPGGTHTPMFMWWKGKLQPGNYDKLISAMDFYPTALDAADISIPKDLKLDGVSLLPWLQDKKQGEPHKNLTWITSYSHWFDEENIPFWDNYHKFVRHQSDDYPHNPNTEDLSQFSYTVRNNDYSLVYTVENNQLGLYKLTDLQQKDNLAAANPQVVKEMQGVVREFIDSSQPPLSEVNQEKFNNIKKALSEAK